MKVNYEQCFFCKHYVAFYGGEEMTLTDKYCKKNKCFIPQKAVLCTEYKGQKGN